MVGIPFFIAVQFSPSVMSNSFRLHGLQHARLPCPSPTPRESLLKLMSIELVLPSNHLILCYPLSPPAFNLSQYQAGSFPMSQFFISGGQSIGASASVLPVDWFDLLAVQGTLRGLLQHHSSKAPILQCLAFFMVQLSHSYMTTGKTKALTR